MSARNLLLAACILATFLLAQAAHAEDCANATTQAAMNSCAASAFTKADAALNATYAQVTSRLAHAPDTKRSLVAAQRAWLAFRDAECTFETASTVDGSIHPMLVSICRTGLTQAREKSFRAMLHCAEGDLSCPIPPG